MRELRREFKINAPPERIWVVVTDFGAYPDWNPFIRRISGEIREGARLEVRIGAAGCASDDVQAHLFATSRRIASCAGSAASSCPASSTASTAFGFQPLDGARSRFVQSERVSGFLVGLFKGTLAKTEAGFEEMNTRLKARAEQASA